MSYEVTKRIKGHDYRYRVEGVRDPETGRTRSHWQYLGRLEGDDVIAPARVATRRVTRDELVAVTARLLETREASRVTVSVIAHRAGVSSGTFYRHFHDRRSALGAAVAYLGDALLAQLPPLGGRLASYDDERERLAGWFASLNRATLDGRALRWFLTQADEATQKVVEDGFSVVDDLRRLLREYLERLNAHERAHIADPDALAAALLRLHLSVVRDQASIDDPAEAASRWAEVALVIERAVFPHERVAA